MRKNHQLKIVWLVVAFLCVAASILQIQMSLAKERAEKNKSLPPPVKTRHYVRDGSDAKQPKVGTTGKNQGLNVREIGWIIEDFQFAGLDQGMRAATPEAYLAQRRQQDRWFVDLMAKAWSLTPEQAARMKENIGKIFEQAKAEFVKDITNAAAPFEKDGKWYRVISADPIHRLMDIERRMLDSPEIYLPWNLCDFPKPAAVQPDATNIRSLHPIFNDLKWIDAYLPPPAPAVSTDDLLGFVKSLEPARLQFYLLAKPGSLVAIQKALQSDSAPQK
jgi:hypothetical protein